jgi:hypothetical protein
VFLSLALFITFRLVERICRFVCQMRHFTLFVSEKSPFGGKFQEKIWFTQKSNIIFACSNKVKFKESETSLYI